MIEALITGKLQGQPEQRTSKSGRAYVQCRLRVPAGADETYFIRVCAFSETACAALLPLGDGDAVSVAGTLKVSVWTPPTGEPRPNLDVVAGQVLSAYHLERRRKGVQPSAEHEHAPAPRPARHREPQHRAEPDFDAADDQWLSGGAS